MKFVKPENPYDSDYFKLTIREWREHIQQVALEPLPLDGLPDGVDAQLAIDLATGTLELSGVIDRMEEEALKYIGPVEFADSTMSQVARLILARRPAPQAGEQPPAIPTRPSAGATREEWFRYKLHLGRRFTHKDLAKELGYAEGYVRKLYAEWIAGIDQDT